MTAVRLERISEAAFLASEPNRRLIAHEYARCFADLRLPDCVAPLKISWRSDSLEPTITMDERGPTTWVGIDDRVAAVGGNGQIQFSIALDTPLLAILQWHAGVVAVCELSSIVIARTFCIRAILEFHDIPERYEMTDNQLLVAFMDGTVREYDLRDR
jgi:hypothetical protein